MPARGSALLMVDQGPWGSNSAAYSDARGDLVCWAKNGRLVLNEVKPNVYREIYLYICFMA